MPLVLSSAIAPHSVFITVLHIVSTEELCTSAIESYLTPCTHTQPSVSHRDVILKFIITSKFEQTVTKAKKEQLRRARNKKLDEPTTGILMTRFLLFPIMFARLRLPEYYTGLRSSVTPL
jgi:hypothetical protein